MKTIIYVRTSSKEQNPESQIPVLEKLCEEFGFKEWKIIIEKKSAWKDDEKREKFDKIEEKIKKRELDNLIVWDIDRIYRNRKKLKGFFEFSKAHNCNILSQRQQFLNQIQKVKLPEGFGFIKDMMVDNFIQFLGWIAEEESKKKSERVKLAVRKEDGVTKSYKGNKWGRKTLPKRVDQEIIKLRDEGKTIKEISKQVYYTDKNKNKKYVSVGYVHKTLKENKGKKE